MYTLYSTNVVSEYQLPIQTIKQPYTQQVVHLTNNCYKWKERKMLLFTRFSRFVFLFKQLSNVNTNTAIYMFIHM